MEKEIDKIDIVLEIEGEISKLELKPNDVIMVKISNNLPAHAYYALASRIHEKLYNVFPDNEVIIYNDLVDISIISKEDK